MRRTLWSAVTLGLVVSLLPASAPGVECTDEPTYKDSVTSPSAAIPGFPDRRATTQELIDYSRQIDEESERVRTGTYARSVNGTPLVYSLVGAQNAIENARQVAGTQNRLRDPRSTSSAQADSIARTERAIVWYTGNVHGNETSGADAAISIMYELAARTDCHVKQMLDELMVGIIPTQNPDGRDSFSRTNAYGFDMNRDWFARTQPETDGKLDLLARFPPVLFIDAHEMGNSSFFFPPNADPIYHEISGEALGWINNIYGKALQKKFEERQESDPLNWDYFNYSVYDLFYMGYGDTVPTTAFTSAGMTFEKGIADLDRQRWEEQFVAGWTSLQQAASHKDRILSEYYAAHEKALRDGRAGVLEPNLVLQEENEVRRRVPDIAVRSYFITPRHAYPDVARLIERLLKMDVEIYKLRRPLRSVHLQRYARGSGIGTVPKGSYWIPMAQPQKRWIQAMLHADTYVPFPYFYDVTAWSNPLLMDLEASFTRDVVSPRAKRIAAAPAGKVTRARRARLFYFSGDSAGAAAGALYLARNDAQVSRLRRSTKVGGKRLAAGTFVASDARRKTIRNAARRYTLRITGSRKRLPSGPRLQQPKIALYRSQSGGESDGHLRFMLDLRWNIPFDRVTGPEVAAGALTSSDYDVFIVPGVRTDDLQPASEQIRSWIDSGGIYAGTARPGDTGGTAFAIQHGYTTSTSQDLEGAQIPGTMFKVRVDRRASPLTLGAPRTAYWYQLGENVLTPSKDGANAVLYPGKSGMWSSGYSEGENVLVGSAGLVDEKLGQGRVVLFSGEPNFRAFTEGPQLFLLNAIVYPQDAKAEGRDVRSSPQARAAAMQSVGPSIGPGRPIRLKVPIPDLTAALEVVDGFTDHAAVAHVGRRAVIEIPNPTGLDPEMHPYSGELLPALRDAGVRVLSAIL